MRPIMILILSFIMCVNLSGSADRDYAEPMPFKNIGISPRARAFGNFVDALSDDGFALHYNPAGLAQLYSMNVNLGFGYLTADRLIFNLTYSHIVSKIGTFAIGGTYFRLGDIEERDESGELIGSTSDQQIGASLGYGKELDFLTKGLMVGLKAEYLMHKIFDGSASGFSLSYGILYRFYAVDFLKDLSVGLSLHNLPGSIKWNTGTKEDLRTAVSFGVAYRLFYEHLILSAGVKYKKDVPLEYGGGIEYAYKNFTLRGGAAPNFYNMGIGFSYDVYNFDYNITFDQIGYNHFISVNYQFGGKVAEEIRRKIMRDVIASRAEEAYAQGLFHMENYRYKEAMRSFQLALLWDPEMKKAEKKLKEVESLLTEEEKKKAMEKKKVRELEIKKGWCPPAKILLKHYYAGITAYMEGDLKKAIKEWEFVLKCDPKNERARLNILKAKAKLRELK